jgi:hypothetical protein
MGEGFNTLRKRRQLRGTGPLTLDPPREAQRYRDGATGRNADPP